MCPRLLLQPAGCVALAALIMHLHAGAGAILLEAPATPAPSAAVNQADRARAHTVQELDAMPTVELVEPAAARSPSGRSATDARARSKRFLSNNGVETTESNVPLAPVPAATLGANPASVTNPAAHTQRTESALAKARRYANGGDASAPKAGLFVRLGTAVGVVGADGVIVFACSDTDNIAGRVGDSVKPGSLFTVLMNGRATPARCR